MLTRVSDFLSTGHFRILLFTASDLLEPHGNSSQALIGICNDIISTFPNDTVELVVILPFVEQVFEWTDIPTCAKEFAEMRFHGPVDQKLYDTYGVSQDAGLVVVVRPDGYIGLLSSLADFSQADTYLSACLVRAR
jgi:phenol 2-monooxygenase